MRVMLFVIALLQAACGSTPLNTDVPAVFDLNGHWVVHAPLSDPPLDRRRLQAAADRALLDMRSDSSEADAGLIWIVEDFPGVVADSMVIEQDSASMGIRYQGGVYRDLSWGERRRGLWQVSAGWHEGSLLIESRADDARAREVFTLSPDRSRLIVVTELKAGGDTLVNRRVFDRVASGSG